MTTFSIIKGATIPQTPLTSAGQRSGADSGDPQVSIQTIAPEAAGDIGIWECQPGGWPVVNRPDTEFAYIISGKARLTDDQTGAVIDVEGGDLVVLPQGWSGRWDIINTVRKVYVIY